MNIQLTNRDLNILNFLEHIGFASSYVIRELFGEKSQSKTFNLRLNKLKKAGYISEIGAKQRIINQHKIYQLTNKKKLLKEINELYGISLNPSNFNLSYTLINHQVFLGKLISIFISKLRETDKDYSIDFRFTYGSKKIQEILQRELKNNNSNYNYLDKVLIPDFLIEYNKKLYCFELENTNSYKQFEEKINYYNDLNIYKNNEKFLDIFRKKSIILIIGTWEYKIKKYKEIIKNNLNSIKNTTIIIDNL